MAGPALKSIGGNSPKRFLYSLTTLEYRSLSIVVVIMPTRR